MTWKRISDELPEVGEIVLVITHGHGHGMLYPIMLFAVRVRRDDQIYWSRVDCVLYHKGKWGAENYSVQYPEVPVRYWHRWPQPPTEDEG